MLDRKIILSTDSACDLNENFSSKYKINYYPFYIHLNNRQYKDGVDLFPDDIYKIYYERKILPKTSAISIGDYKTYFEGLKKRGYDILHINLSSGISSTYQNCCIAAREVGNVYPVDSYNLSTAIGILVIKAGKMVEEGFDVLHIQKELSLITKKLRSSFVVDSLEFLRAGGRCSSIATIGAKLFNIKPCIEVNKDGKMVLGKKYRGSFDKVLLKYTDDTLENIDSINKEQIFITHAGAFQDCIDAVYKKIREMNYFDNIYIQRAGCTISSHCGPNTLGLMFLTK